MTWSGSASSSDKLRHGTPPGPDTGQTARTARRGRRHGADSSAPDVPAAFGGACPGEALEQAIIGKAVELLSGPGGLASFLRRKLLDERLTGPSLPLDIGYSDTIPAGIRNAVRLRGGHCEWAGGCSQPAARLPGPPHQAQSQRRQDQPQRLRAAVPLPPPGHDPPPRLDPGRQPRRDHHRLEQGQDQGPPQPRTTRPSRVTPARSREQSAALHAQGDTAPDDARQGNLTPRRHPVLSAVKVTSRPRRTVRS